MIPYIFLLDPYALFRHKILQYIISVLIHLLLDLQILLNIRLLFLQILLLFFQNFLSFFSQPLLSKALVHNFKILFRNKQGILACQLSNKIHWGLWQLKSFHQQNLSQRLVTFWNYVYKFRSHFGPAIVSYHKSKCSNSSLFVSGSTFLSFSGSSRADKGIVEGPIILLKLQRIPQSVDSVPGAWVVLYIQANRKSLLIFKIMVVLLAVFF